MLTPRSASFSAMPRPIPRELPVTSARFPWSGMPTSFADGVLGQGPPRAERTAQWPQGELRERSVRWSGMLGSRPPLQSLEDLVGSRQQRLRDSYSEHLCGLEIDHEL